MNDFRLQQKRYKRSRLIVLIVILAISTALGCLHQFSRGIRPVGVDALCPFGGIESAITLFTTGMMLERVAWSSFILLLAVLISAVLFRRSFCGHICPLGTLQELFGRLGRTIFKRRCSLPRKIDRPLRLLKYAVFVVFVGLSVWLGRMVIRPYDPWVAYHHLLSTELLREFTIGFIVLVISLIGSLLLDRFFCKYLCPMGGFLALIRRIGWFRIKRREATCTHCMACDQICPVNIAVESVDQVHSAECINCNLCVNACPVPETLIIGEPTKGKISAGMMLWITVALFTVVVGFSTLTGNFQWTQKSLAATVKTYAAFDPQMIKGRDTFRAVAEVSGIPKEKFLSRFQLSSRDFNRPIKDSAHRPDSDFSVSTVRTFVQQEMSR